MNISPLRATLLATLASTLTASALTITLPDVAGYDRYATLTSATDGAFGTGNTSQADINAAFPGLAPWSHPVGEATDSLPTGSGLLTISVDSGGWGQPPVSGTWTLDPLYWTFYDAAVISMHVGNGPSTSDPTENEPDHFIWLIEYGQLSGDWSYDSNDGKGGGLSNLQLWASGEGRNVPDGGTTLALFGASLLGLAGLRRKLRK